MLPPHLEEYQRLRCRVAYHALRFREEVQELTTKILNRSMTEHKTFFQFSFTLLLLISRTTLSVRLRAPGRPFIAFDPGMTRDALAYYGCAELFQVPLPNPDGMLVALIYQTF